MAGKTDLPDTLSPSDSSAARLTDFSDGNVSVGTSSSDKISFASPQSASASKQVSGKSVLTRDDVLKLAKLSRLKLSDDEIESFRAEMNEILGYVQMLDKVDTTGLRPTYQVTGLKNVMRKDELIAYQAQPDDLLKNLPARDKNYVKVKKML